MTAPSRSLYGQLVHHFLGRFFRSEHGRHDAAIRERLAGTMAALAVVSPVVFFTLLTVYLFMGGEVAAMWPFGTHYFGICIIASGFLAVVAWDELFPDDVDQAVLAALPLRRSTLMWAKASAVGILMGAGTLTLGALTPFVFAINCLPPNGTGGQFWRLVLGYFTGACLACLSTFFTCGALRGVSLLLPDWRGVRRASSWVQSLLAFALIGGFALLPWMARRLPEWVAADSPILLAAPPTWFVGLEQVIVGQRGPAIDRLAALALAAPLVCGLLFAALLTLGFRRFTSLTEDKGEGTGAASRSRFLAPAVNRVLLRDPQARATFWFFLITLWRGPKQRLRLLSYLGAAAGWIVVAQAAGADGLSFAAPVAAFLAVAGARSAAASPCFQRAGWIVRMTETPTKGGYLRGLRWGVWLGVLCPVFCVLALVLASFGSTPSLAAHLFFNLLAAFLLAEAAVLPVPSFPCTSLPGPGHFQGPLFLVLGFYAYVKTIGSVERYLLTDLPSTLVAFGLMALSLGVAILLRRSPTYDFAYQDAGDLMEYSLSGLEED